MCWSYLQELQGGSGAPSHEGGGGGVSGRQKIELYLLQLEDVLVEVVLEALVGEVDAELLETVVLIILEAKDIQDSDGQNLTT